MTRETKLGLVVAGSFLLLVGGVVAMKYSGKPPQQETPVTQGNAPPASEGDKPQTNGILPVSSAEPRNLPADLHNVNNDQNPRLVSAPPEPDAPTINNGVKPDPASDIILPPLVAPTTPKEDSKKPKLTLVLTKKDPKRNGKSANADSPLAISPPEELLVVPPVVDPRNVIEKKPMNGGKSDDLPLLAVDAPKAIDDIKKPMIDDIPLIPLTAPKTPADKKPMKESKIDAFPPISLDAPKAIGDIKKPMEDGKAIDIPSMDVREPKKNGRVEPKPNGLDLVAPPPDAIAPPAVTEFKSTKPDRDTANSTTIKIPMSGAVSPEPKGQAATLIPDAPLNRVDSVVPAAPKPDAGKVDAPKQDNGYDEDIHPLKPNETYTAISKQYYNSDAYSTALQRYNRDTPGGLANNLRIPPIWVLEKKYPADVANAGTRSVGYVQPAADLPKVNEPVYTVSDNGEMIADVAKKTLGGDDYQTWQRIYTLNPQINPGKLIPGGTRLRLPDGTRTP